MQNKALDYNKLLEQQEQGKLLKKQLVFPVCATTKFDGNYTYTRIENGRATHTTSGGLTYRHTDDISIIFRNLVDGVYLGERIAGKGKLGDRVRCNLRGPKDNQTSTKHSYIFFDYLTLDEADRGYSTTDYLDRMTYLMVHSGMHGDYIAKVKILSNRVDMYTHLRNVVNDGYEGIMLMAHDWKWKDTKSRTIDFCKLKSRRTADLVCININEGEGKYEGMIGSLILQDSSGRQVSVGSGLNDEDRSRPPMYFMGSVVEIEFEQIIETYIQPTFIRLRNDKHPEDID